LAHLADAAAPLTETQLRDTVTASDPSSHAARRLLADMGRSNAVARRHAPRLAALIPRWARLFPDLASWSLNGPWQAILRPLVRDGSLQAATAMPMLLASNITFAQLLALVPDALLDQSWIKALLLSPRKDLREATIRALGRTVEERPQTSAGGYGAPATDNGQSLDVRA